LSERIGARAACALGSLLSAAGFGSLAILAPGVGAMPAIAGLVMGGAGLGFANGPAHAAAIATIDRKMSGIASGLLAMSRYVGGLIGITLLSLLLAAPGAAHSLSRHHLAVVVMAGFLLAAVGISLLLPGRARTEVGVK
jgi:hypothetical protein